MAPKLVTEGSVFVAVPEDGRYETQLYPGSGFATAETLARTLEKHGVKVERGAISEKREAAEVRARTLACRYYMDFLITHWEDRATEWTGMPDKVELQLTLTDLTTDQVVDSIKIVGTSSWFTLGGDHPKDLLVVPFGQYVDSLYGALPTQKPFDD